MSKLPLPDEYRGAVQNPSNNFRDTSLKQGRVMTNKLDLPLVWSGQNATVFKIETPNGVKAVRCFTSKLSDQQNRYKALSTHVKTRSLSMLVDFDYQPKGILVKGVWHPIVMMDWVNGVTLDHYIEERIAHKDADSLNNLATQWHKTVKNLRHGEMAHGDLQHENILVQNGMIRLVDYDGAFVPKLKNKKAIELGHLHYQHPNRTGNDFYLDIDNFSAWVIYLSLKSLAIDPSLWARFHKDKHLILLKNDFCSPRQSDLFKALKKISDNVVRELTETLEQACSKAVQNVPPLEVIGNTTEIGGDWKKSWMHKSPSDPQTSSGGGDWKKSWMHKSPSDPQTPSGGGDWKKTWMHKSQSDPQTSSEGGDWKKTWIQNQPTTAQSHQIPTIINTSITLKSRERFINALIAGGLSVTGIMVALYATSWRQPILLAEEINNLTGLSLTADFVEIFVVVLGIGALLVGFVAILYLIGAIIAWFNKD